MEWARDFLILRATATDNLIIADFLTGFFGGVRRHPRRVCTPGPPDYSKSTTRSARPFSPSTTFKLPLRLPAAPGAWRSASQTYLTLAAKTATFFLRYAEKQEVWLCSRSSYSYLKK